MARRYYAKSDRSLEFSREAGRRGFFGRPTWIVFGIFVLAVCVAFSIPAIPQYRELQKIEAELVEAEKEEQAMLKRCRQLEAEATALRKNQDYLEARSRDPLRYHVPGERVIQLD